MVYIGDFYNRYYKYYDDIYEDYFTSENTKELINFIGKNLKENSYIIDLGCGKGHQLEMILSMPEFVGKIKKAIGIDISEEMIKQAEVKLTNLKNEIKLIRGNFLEDGTIQDIKQEVSENGCIFIMCLGNTLGHISPNHYDNFVNNICMICDKAREAQVILEIRDGEELKREAPVFEIRKMQINGDDDFKIIYYYMSHYENSEGRYPVIVNIVAQKPRENINLIRFYNDEGYYVKIEDLNNLFINERFEKEENNLKSALPYGKILIYK